MGTYFFCDSLSLKTVAERIHAVAQMIDPAEGTLVTIKYADGGSMRKRFLPSQPFQDIVMFVGAPDMASETFCLDLPMSSASYTRAQAGTVVDSGIVEDVVLYTIWLAEDQVEVTTFTFRQIQQSDISTGSPSCLYLKKIT